VSASDVEDYAAVRARFKAQNDEFDAVSLLSEAYRRLCAVAVVDDSYPARRHAYEGAIRGLLAACRANGRLS
jgi:hypothetical protein